MAKVKTFKTIFPAVSVPLNDDYSINERSSALICAGSRASTARESKVWSATATLVRSPA